MLSVPSLADFPAASRKDAFDLLRHLNTYHTALLGLLPTPSPPHPSPSSPGPPSLRTRLGEDGPTAQGPSTGGDMTQAAIDDLTDHLGALQALSLGDGEGDSGSDFDWNESNTTEFLDGFRGFSS